MITGGKNYYIIGPDGNVITDLTYAEVILALGYVPVPDTRTLTIDGITYDLTADRTWVTGGGSANCITLTINATVNIAAFDVVTSMGLIGDSSIIAYKNKIVGIATAPILSGFNGSVVGFGKITNPLWAWTVGDRIFLNGTSLSTTAPSSGFIQIIGVAIASDTIDIKLAQSILL